jgi:hypothetical protein
MQWCSEAIPFKVGRFQRHKAGHAGAEKPALFAERQAPFTHS